MSAAQTTTSDIRLRSDTPALQESPPRPVVHSTTKSWCSSPFSNLVALSPDGNSLSFQLDFSPGISFASAMKYQVDQGSPQSGNKRQRDSYGSIFSPSLFSPFNKTLKSNKLDKGLDADYLIDDIPNSDSKLPFSPGSGYKDINLFKKHMSTYEPVEFELMNFAVPNNNSNNSSTSSSSTTYNDTSFLSDKMDLDNNISISHSSNHRHKASYDNGEQDSNDSSTSNSYNHPSSLTSPDKRRRKDNSENENDPFANFSSSQNNSSALYLGQQMSTTKNVPPLSGRIRTPLSKPRTGHSNNSNTNSSTCSNSNDIHKNISSTPSNKTLLFSSPIDILVRAKQTPANLSPNFPPILEMNTNNSEKNLCNCKKSKCLKLYCECFAALKYCSGCNCSDCYNCKDHEDARRAAIEATKERNISAFQVKVNPKKGQHLSGCHCKKSRCLKKYCECFEGEVYCGAHCKCLTCENTEEMAIKDNRSKLNNIESPSVANGRSKSNQWHHNSNRSNINTISEVNEDDDITEDSEIDDNSINNKRKSSCIYDCEDSPDSSVSVASSQSMNENKKIINDIILNTYDNGEDCDGSSVASSQSQQLSLQSSDSNNNSCDTSPCSSVMSNTPPLYYFFGTNSQPLPKITALRCLEYLDGKDIYSISVVNRLWCQASMDDALWE